MELDSETGRAESLGPAIGHAVACEPAAPDAAVPVHKPFLSPEELVASLKARGVTFDLCSEPEAAAYLRGSNNYLRVASYRALFDRKPGESGAAGPYANLDFGHLRDLASIDRQLREAFLQVCIDVEHFARLGVLNRAKAEGEDGYAMVADYLRDVSHKERNRLSGGLAARAREGATHDEYTGDLIAHHLGDLPLWVFLEVVEFGAFVDFYRFCATRWGDADMAQEHYVLKSVKALRNACAHNSCVVNGFTPGSKRPMTVPHTLVSESLTTSGMPNSKTRRSKLGNLRVMQMASALWALDRFCTSGRAKARAAARLDALRRRFETSRALYDKTNSIAPYFDFLWRLVDIWVPLRA